MTLFGFNTAPSLSTASSLIPSPLKMMIEIAPLALFLGSFELKLAMAFHNALAFQDRIHMASMLVKLIIKETFMKFYFIYASII